MLRKQFAVKGNQHTHLIWSSKLEGKKIHPDPLKKHFFDDFFRMEIKGPALPKYKFCTSKYLG